MLVSVERNVKTPGRGRRSRLPGRLGLAAIVPLVCLALSTCATQTTRRDELCPYRGWEAARAAPGERELQVLGSAKKLLGIKYGAKGAVNGRQFTFDCSGTVCAIYYRLGIDLAKDFARYPGNASNRLYLSLKDRGVIHYDRYPRIGDIIFWDNTYDANGNGDRTDDLRSHTGMVVGVDDDGTIHYIHASVLRGVVVEVMNLMRPRDAYDGQGKRINSGMAIATVPGGPKPAKELAGDTFQSFGDALKVEADYQVDSGGKAAAAPTAFRQAR